VANGRNLEIELHSLLLHERFLKLGKYYIPIVNLESLTKKKRRENNNMEQYPKDWDTIFTYPYDIGCGGSEKPFLKNKKWYLNVLNLKDHKRYTYDYEENIYIPVNISLDKLN
jgi:hypothetical protein